MEEKWTREIPFDDTMPLFIRGGFIVSVQNTTDILRSRNLNNQFYLVVALDEFLQASGEMLTLNSYEDANVIAKCLNGENCVMKINIVASMINYNLKVDSSVRGQKCNTNFDEVIILGYRIYGLQDPQGNYIIVDEKFSDTWIITMDNVQHNYNIDMTKYIE